MSKPIRVTVWNEFVHEKCRPEVRKVYPDGLHAVIAEGLRERLGDAVAVRTATLDQPYQGLDDDLLAKHRRVVLVGATPRTTRWKTPWSTTSSNACWKGWAWSCCTRATPRRSSAA